MRRANPQRRRRKVPPRVPIDHGEPSALARGRANVHPLAALQHGADHEPTIAPKREAHLIRERQRFPDADDPILAIQAQRAAVMDALVAFLDEKSGPVRNRRTGIVFPAAERWAKEASAYERTHERLEALEREHSPQAHSLASIAEELTTP